MLFFFNVNVFVVDFKSKMCDINVFNEPGEGQDAERFEQVDNVEGAATVAGKG